MAIFLGADIGTSNVKAVLVDEQHRILCRAAHPLRSRRPRAGWSEQDPLAWWRAFLHVCADLRNVAPREWRAVASVGVTGQMHAALCLDDGDRPLRPAILWNDGRARAECSDLMHRLPRLRDIAGVLPMAGFTAPKFLWLSRHEPDIFARIAHVLLPKDFIVLNLSGEHVTDMSDAAGTLWLDQARRCWSRPLVEATGLALSQLPRLAEGSAAVGALRPKIAAQLGLATSVLVAAGGGDAAASAVGIGAVAQGDSFLSIGTSAQYFIADQRFRLPAEPTVHAFAHCLPRRWYRMAALLNGANCLDWICTILGTDAQTALAGVAKTMRKPSPLLFLPYLAGERTPHNDPGLRASFLGLGAATGPGEMIQAVLEAVALALADVEQYLRPGPAASRPLAVVGGAASSPLWMQILADVLNRELVLCRNSAIAAPLGAARLARLALFGERVATVCTKPKPARCFVPRRQWHQAYEEKLAQFRRAFPLSQVATGDRGGGL